MVSVLTDGSTLVSLAPSASPEESLELHPVIVKATVAAMATTVVQPRLEVLRMIVPRFVRPGVAPPYAAASGRPWCQTPPMADAATDAWAAWAATLAALPERLDDADFPVDPAGRAVAVRHLARQAALALEGELEHSDPAHPLLHRYEQPWSQWGAPNPDNVYQRCAIDPGATYVLRGQVAGVHEALFSLVEGDMHLGENGVFAEDALSDLEVGEDGVLVLTIGPKERGDGARLVSSPGARMLLIRQYLYDWAADPIASFTIERLDTTGRPPPAPTPDAIADALARATRWVEESISFWAAYAAASRDLPDHNTFTPPNTPPGGAPSIAYGGGCWDLGPDEVLVIEHDEPDAHYWNWSVHHLHWFDSGAWHQRSTSTNGHQAHVDEDGRVRVVVSAADPGVPNWLDTEGRPLGMVVYRYVGARTKPHPAATVVAASDLRSVLPGDHPTTTPEQRRDQLAVRSRAAQRRWG